MKKISILSLAAVLFAAILTVGCQKEPKFNPIIGEGCPVNSISFEASLPIENLLVGTKASNEVETNVESLAIVLIKKEAGATAKVFKAEALGTPNKVTETNYIYNVNFDLEGAGIYGGSYYLYGIANEAKQFVEVDINSLEGMTKDEIDALILTKGNNDLDISQSSILMSGRYCEGSSTDGSVTLNGVDETSNPTGGNTLTGTIHLRRIVAKVQFTFSTASTAISFVPKTYSIYNYSRSCTLMERDGWNGSDPQALEFGGSTSISAFRNVLDRTVTNNTVIFYMPENVQKAKNTVSTYAGREAHVSATDQSFANAPDKGTYLVVTGEYSDATYTGEVRYIIHLGDFSNGNTSKSKSGNGAYGNFTVRRNYKYNYYIKINGVNSIVTECLAEDDSEPQPGAEGDIVEFEESTVFNLDAHYEQALIAFPASNTLDTYQLIVNTPYTNGNVIDDGTGLDSKSLLKYAGWVKFGKPVLSGTDVVFQGYDPTAVTDVYGLIEDLKDGTANYYLTSGGNNYVTAYVDEYYYTQDADGNAADLKDFIGADNRSITLSIEAIKTSKDKQSSLVNGVVFSLRQKSIGCVENLASENPFGYERVEENDQPTAYPTVLSYGSDDTNGWSNFQQILAGSNSGTISGSSLSWSDYVSVTSNGYLSSSEVGETMATSYDNGYYQCLSRNRDENGNGVIDEEEVKWYLPAVNQYTTLYICENDMTDSDRLHQTNPSEHWYVTSSSDALRLYFANQGVATSRYESATWLDDISGWAAHVRCVRNLKTYNAAPSRIAVVSGQDVSMGNINDNVLRESLVEGEYYPHTNRSDENFYALPRQFRVASADLEYESLVSSESTTTTGNPTITVTTNYTSTYSGSLSNLVDGSSSTYWWSGDSQTTGKYVLFTFSEPVYLETLTITSNDNGGKDYPTTSTDFQISENGTDWVSVGTGAYTLVHSFTLTAAQTAMKTMYVRIYSTGPASSSQNPGSDKWMSLSEFEYSGNPVYAAGETITNNTYETVSTFDYYGTNGVTGTDTGSGWTYARNKEEDYCQKYYTEEAGDLGKWRIPNEKELFIMKTYSLFTVANNYLCRTQFKSGEQNSVFHYVGSNGSYNLTTNRDTGLTYHLRCVRDIPATGADASYVYGGTIIE